MSREESKHKTCSNEFVVGRKRYLGACRSVKRGKDPEKGRGSWPMNTALTDYDSLKTRLVPIFPLIWDRKSRISSLTLLLSVKRCGRTRALPGRREKRQRKGPICLHCCSCSLLLPWGFSMSDIKVFAYLYSGVFKTFIGDTYYA